jgi:hypothetical protein
MKSALTPWGRLRWRIWAQSKHRGILWQVHALQRCDDEMPVAVIAEAVLGKPETSRCQAECEARVQSLSQQPGLRDMLLIKTGEAK